MSCPKKPLDWDKIDSLLIAGCPGTEVAGSLGIHPDTLYARVEEEKGMGFSSYLSEKRSNGKALIRQKQFNKALDGDSTLLIWLGKTSLEQREHAQLADSEKEKKFDEKMDQVLSLLNPSSALKIDDSNINNETKS